ncbi:hypothetical protein L0669_17120 [Flavobacterium bizetiae]|uniref:hypothetical protein n=1 Tax=Flavobacterium bizetiae TaxID=2704140 RepID=UPI0021E7FEA4|nr:hypothetical protein [Flavobacterium bizetiae]UTN03048.1 hypothetical protein L0669_17120 [Flavobacterium bizetiae]
MRKILLLALALYTSNNTLNAQVINGDNSYGTILATATENQFSLYSKTLSTQPVNSESFRLGLKHNNDENNGFISFYRGMSTSGGFMGFSTNGTERMRIASNGNIGIGSESPNGLLDIRRTTLNAGGQSVVNIIGSTWAGDGASLVLNQLWNDQSYKTIIDNFGGNNAQTGSGLKVQTSYWNGTEVKTITSLTLTPGGNLGIGQTDPQNKLDVNGTIHSKEVRVDMLGWSDFVFKKEYNLPTLEDVEKHINEKGHLENIPNEEEVLKNGINLGEMNAKLLQKIEEMTLYMIDIKNKQSELENELHQLKTKLKQ